MAPALARREVTKSEIFLRNRQGRLRQLGAQRGDPRGDLGPIGQAAGVAAVGSEPGVLIGILQPRAPGPLLGECFMTRILQNGHIDPCMAGLEPAYCNVLGACQYAKGGLGPCFALWKPIQIPRPSTYPRASLFTGPIAA